MKPKLPMLDPANSMKVEVSHNVRGYTEGSVFYDTDAQAENAVDRCAKQDGFAIWKRRTTFHLNKDIRQVLTESMIYRANSARYVGQFTRCEAKRTSLETEMVCGKHHEVFVAELDWDEYRDWTPDPPEPFDEDDE